MSELSPQPEPASTDDVGDAPAARKRPKPGERRVQILQALATMLEQPGAERITTAALAARLPDAARPDALPAYLADPNGYLVLRYAPGFNPSGLRKDLGRVLK